jgi:hypothetical protein
MVRFQLMFSSFEQMLLLKIVAKQRIIAEVKKWKPNFRGR